MNPRINGFTKFQIDFDKYLNYYGTFIVEGNIYDEVPVQINMSDGSKKIRCQPDITGYLDAAYNICRFPADSQKGGYVVCTYDSGRAEGHRFSLFSEQNLGPILGEGRVKLLKTVLGIVAPIEFNPDQQVKTADPTPEEKAKTEAENKEMEAIEAQFDVSHANEGLSLDIARLSFAIQHVLNKADGTPIVPFIFIFLNASRFSLSPGTVQNDSERQAFGALAEMTKTIKDHKLIFLAEKTNDLPAWLENEKYNISVKKLTVVLPTVKLRGALIGEEVVPYLDKPYFVYFQTLCHNRRLAGLKEKPAEENPTADRNKMVEDLVNATGGFTIKRLKLFLSYLASDDPFEDEKPLPLDKALIKFNFGSNDANPWDSPSIFNAIAGIEGAINDALSGQEKVAAQIRTLLGLAVTGFKRVSNPKAPRAVLFLAGPTGTGKTEVTKIIAQTIFGSAENMIRFDMSEFSQEHTDQRLFGAPPGYVGFDAGGELTNAVRQNPFSLILFDEIEKAHPRILDKFLQILSDGRLTDGQGRTVSFENCVIVMTSNAGLTVRTASGTDEKGAPVSYVDPVLLDAFSKNNVNPKLASVEIMQKIDDGIPVPSTDSIPMDNLDDFYDHLVRFVRCNLSYFFEKELNRKEIYGRLVDSIVVYNYISKKAIQGIVDKEIQRTNSFCADRYGLVDQTDPKAKTAIKDWLVVQASVKETRDLGGRGIIKKVDELYGAPISQAILDRRVPQAETGGPSRTIALSLVDNHIEVTLAENPATPAQGQA